MLRTATAPLFRQAASKAILSSRTTAPFSTSALRASYEDTIKNLLIQKDSKVRHECSASRANITKSRYPRL